MLLQNTPLCNCNKKHFILLTNLWEKQIYMFSLWYTYCYILTWDQAQFERFSYILSNGYRFRFAMPTRMLFTKRNENRAWSQVSYIPVFFKHSFPHGNVGKEQLKIFIFVHKYDIYKIFSIENKTFKTGLTIFIFLAILFYLTPKACPEVI